MVIEKIVVAKYSIEPNRRVTVAKSGAIKIKQRMPNKPPRKE
jgi:hypothetical protein